MEKNKETTFKFSLDQRGMITIEDPALLALVAGATATVRDEQGDSIANPDVYIQADADADYHNRGCGSNFRCEPIKKKK
ncbi:hypothetical protein [Parachitinimonas caeni]|uniref:Uncharacterized protein n=1 Tax=Parachitinimonas caeni TaxID=3031301 RepID=A0ABT7E2M3_9NEIS|nr:hypothetical protein [Parachitinimonas caeni]MDK2125650.1 hypothetical protein [Parachitinimonas caeni]